jgi:transposase
MVDEYDALDARGDRGALLRREGLYHSHIIEWRKAREAGTLAPASEPESKQDKENAQDAALRRRRGRSAEAAELERLRKQNERLARDLARTQAALDIMGKAHALGVALRERGPDARAEADRLIAEVFD